MQKIVLEFCDSEGLAYQEVCKGVIEKIYMNSDLMIKYQVGFEVVEQYSVYKIDGNGYAE